MWSRTLSGVHGLPGRILLSIVRQDDCRRGRAPKGLLQVCSMLSCRYILHSHVVLEEVEDLGEE